MEVDLGPAAGSDRRDQSLTTNVSLVSERIQHEQTNSTLENNNYSTNMSNENQETFPHSQSPTYSESTIQTTDANLNLSPLEITNELNRCSVNKIPEVKTKESENKLLIDNNFEQKNTQNLTKSYVGNVREGNIIKEKHNSGNNINLLDTSKMVAIIAESQIISIAALADADLGVNVSENPDIDITDLESTGDDEINAIANQDINDVHEGNYAEAINDAQNIVDMNLENAYNVAGRSNKCSNNYEGINDDDTLDIVSCRSKVNPEPTLLNSNHVSSDKAEPIFKYDKINEMFTNPVCKDQDAVFYPSKNISSSESVNENNFSRNANILSAPDAKWVCEYCEEKQISEERHNEHLAERHSNKVFYCKRCKQFFDRQKLIRHMSRHLQELAPKPKEDTNLQNNNNTSIDASTNSNLDSDKPSQHETDDDDPTKQQSNTIEEEGNEKALEPLSSKNKVVVDISINTTAELELSEEHVSNSNVKIKSTVCSLQRLDSTVPDVALPSFDPISSPTNSTPMLGISSADETRREVVSQQTLNPSETMKLIVEPSLHQNEFQTIGDKLYLNLTSKVVSNTTTSCSFSDKESASMPISPSIAVKNIKCSQIQNITKNNLALDPGNLNKSKIVSTKRKIRTCPTCQKQYTASSSYFYHLKHAHSDNKRYVCDECHQGFRTKANLIQHMPTHTGERKHRCQHCAKSFRTQAARYIHVKEVHSESKAYKCDECNKSFKWAQKLFRHKERHKSERSYVCSECGKSFNVKYDLSRHARTHGAHKLYSCEHCFVTFSQSRYLKVHIDRMHLKRPKTLFARTVDTQTVHAAKDNT